MVRTPKEQSLLNRESLKLYRFFFLQKLESLLQSVSIEVRRMYALHKLYLLFFLHRKLSELIKCSAYC